MRHLLVNIIKDCSKTVGDTNEVDEMTSIALLLQRVFGQQVLDPRWTWRKFSVHQILNLLLFVYVFFGTLQCLTMTDDPELVAEACYTLIMIGIFPLKMLLFINNRFIFRKLYISVKTILMEIVKADSSADIASVLKKGKKIVYTLYSMVLVPCSIYELTTLWNYVKGKRIPLSRSTNTLMPMTSPYYELAWFLHTVFLFEISSTIILDMWFVLLIYFLCAASDSLVKTLQVEKRMVNECKLVYASRLNQSLRKFHFLHMEQVQYLNSLSLMYNWLAFVPLCNAAMCTCLILLLMSKIINYARHCQPKQDQDRFHGSIVKDIVRENVTMARPVVNSSKEVNWRFAPHMLPMFAEIFAYNWFGEQIKTKASNLNMALFKFDWRGLTLKHRKNFHIIVAYMQKNFGIKTVIGKDLSLITMTAVLKVSYQAFTVLQTMNK